MAETTNWTGSIWGTNRGLASVEITREGARIEGRAQLFEPGLGRLEARLTGNWDNANNITATLDQFITNYSVLAVPPQKGALHGTFHPNEKVIKGEWSTDASTSGYFLLVDVTGQAPTQSAGTVPLSPSAPPAESPRPSVPALVTKTVSLGSYRFDLDALRRLVELVKSGTKVPSPAINAVVKGREFIHIGVDSLMADASVPSIIYQLIISASEPAIQVGTSTVTLALKGNEPSNLFVSGYDRVWVEGKASQIQTFLQDHESKATHFLRTYGSYLNSIIFLVMLAFLPSIPLIQNRLKVVGSGFVLLTMLMYSWRLAPNTKVFLREPQVTWYERNAGWLLVILEVALAAFVGYLIQRYLPPH